MISNYRKCLRRQAFSNVSNTFWVRPHWVEVVEVEVQLEGLPEAFVGKRVVQISDLHCSRTVSSNYLRGCIEQINALDADIVVLTGDYITYEGRNGYKQKVLDLMGEIRSREGLFACLGNHDYGVMTRFHQRGRPALREYLTEGMRQRDITVLRNESCAITIDNQRLWMVGLGDLWGNDFRPGRAFADVPTDESTIALVHNPDSMEHLQSFSADAVMCGHTHGGQVHLPFVGPPILPIKNKKYYAGLFSVGGKKLYVNRGLGRVGRVRFNCRPEITVFTLTN